MTFDPNFAIIRTCLVPSLGDQPKFGTGLVLKNICINLLSRVIFERNVLNQKLPKKSLRLPKRFQWLSVVIVFKRFYLASLLIFLLSGYSPTFSVPPVKKSYVAAISQEQKGEVVAESFPQPVILPHPGYLSTKFSSSHPAIDIAVGLGMPIHPITKGIVEETGTDFFGLGKFVVVAHQKGFKSKYAHMGKIYAKTGQEVTSENTLGEVGLTGQTSGPHTHLEVFYNGKYIDPQTILPEIPDIPRITYTKK